MAVQGRGPNANLESLMSDMNDYATTTTDELQRQRRQSRTDGEGSRLAGIGAGLATFVSIIALVFSGYSFYETVLKQAELRVYNPPLIYMYRKDYRDVFAIPLTISNDGAQRGTILSFDLSVTHLGTNKTTKFQNLHYGTTPVGATRLFTPVTVAGNSAFTDVILF
ncbi:MAG: hypothetical protein R3D67_22480, partial [Hyphomicrobiaceae bacterium]